MKASICKELFDYFAGMRGIGLGLGIPEGSGLMIVPEYIKLVHYFAPAPSKVKTPVSPSKVTPRKSRLPFPAHQLP